MTLLSFCTKSKDALMIDKTLTGSMAALGVQYRIVFAATRPRQAESLGKAEYRKCNRAERFDDQEANMGDTRNTTAQGRRPTKEARNGIEKRSRSNAVIHLPG